MKKTAVLGISAYYHDSAAAIVVDGKIIAAAQEERFTRKKHDSRFPSLATAFVMQEAGLRFEDLSAVVFYDKPMLKFERLLETYHAFAPRGLGSFIKAMPVWLKGKLFAKSMIARELAKLGATKVGILFSEHHLSHAAGAFYPSPFEEAAILTIDGVGEWATAVIGAGRREKIRILKEMHFPHSVGLLYSAFTYYLGFRVNSGEYKLMGLAPYGDPKGEQTQLFKAKILESLVDLRDDGSILLNMQYFDFAAGLKMIKEKKWEKLFGYPRRKPESEINGEHTNLASAIQQVTEDIVLRLAATARRLTGSSRLVLAGGVALNCVANGKLAASGIFDDVWVQPAAGDAGGALGAALACYHIYFGNARYTEAGKDGMAYGYLGPSYTNESIAKELNRQDAVYHYFEDYDRLAAVVSKELLAGKVVGWFQGRMEFGPRALGNRSILADPRNPAIQKRINLEIKQREEFRPFAPAVLEEDAAEYFASDAPSPYMLFVTQLRDEWRISVPDDAAGVYEKLYAVRSAFPAVTHVDYSARVQTVGREANPRFRRLLLSFKDISGTGILLNTSFNVRGEPVVCTPGEAYSDFIRTGMDCLVIGDYLLYREEQGTGSIEKQSLPSGKINPAKEQGLSFTIPTGFLYNPLWGIGKPNLVGAFHIGGWANRIRLKLSTLGDGQTEFGWSFPLWGMGKPNSVEAFHFGGSANRIRLKLSPLGDGQTEFGWSFPLWGIGQPKAFFTSSDARSHANQRVEPFCLKYHRKHQIPIFIVSNEGMRYLFAFAGEQ